jgi:hypothetical protein
MKDEGMNARARNTVEERVAVLFQAAASTRKERSLTATSTRVM